MILRHLILVPFLVQNLVAKPYGNYGFYNPYPPSHDQILYEFSPLEENRHGNRDGIAKSRETRDLTWRDEFDQFLDGTKEPTCEQLREMWRVAKELHHMHTTGAGKSNSQEVPDDQELQPFLAFNPISSRGAKQNGGGLTQEVPATHYNSDIEPRADRRRLTSPNSPPNTIAYNKNIMSDTPAATATSSDSKALLRQNVPHVRDPSKEIYGLLRDREISSSSIDNTKPKPYVYGNVKTHHYAPEEPDNRAASYLDLLRDKLYSSSSHRQEHPEQDGDSSKEYGVVRLHESVAPSVSVVSPFDKVRSLVSEERLKDPDVQDAEDPFDLIKERLMNSSGRLRSSKHKSFRRQDNKRRRHIREIALEQQLWQEASARRRALMEVLEQRKRKKAKQRMRRKNRKNRLKKLKLLEKEQRRRERQQMLLRKLRKQQQQQKSMDISKT